jgi:hypothetical protein
VCGTLHTLFKRHEARPRKFRVPWENSILIVLSLVLRWKCQECKKKFTQQPPFALPLKRYVSDAILGFSARYLEDPSCSYRQTVTNEEGFPFHYEAETKGEIDERALAHSTPYRWITYLGALKEIPHRAVDMVLQKSPESSICRLLGALSVSARKFFKPEREWVLKRSWELLHIEASFRATFFVSIFPIYATTCGWR